MNILSDDIDTHRFDVIVCGELRWKIRLQVVVVVSGGPVTMADIVHTIQIQCLYVRRELLCNIADTFKAYFVTCRMRMIRKKHKEGIASREMRRLKIRNGGGERRRWIDDMKRYKRFRT